MQDSSESAGGDLFGEDLRWSSFFTVCYRRL